MIDINKNGLTRALLPVLVFLAIGSIWSSIAFAQEEEKTYIGLRISYDWDPRAPLDDKTTFLGLHMNGLRSPLLRRTLSSFKREVQVDSTGNNINFTEKIGEFNYRLPTYLTLEDYIIQRRTQNLRSKWLNSSVSQLGEASKYARSDGGGIRIDIPVEIKNKAFQRIFGGGTVGLDVSGDISIRGGLRREKRSEVKTALNRGNDTNFKMEQTQRFRVQGHVGEKVTIGVDQDSERTFDFDNNIKLKYEGYDDEIIQSIEAGNIALSLPGTRFVTFGGKSNGLFGIKVAATVGNLKLTAIASQEKGEKKKLSLSGGSSEDASRIEDYQYKKGSYYFLDKYYRTQYMEKTEDGDFIVDPSHIVREVELYKSAPNYQTRYSESIRGWAWVPEETSQQVITQSDTSRIDQNTYRGYFLRLEKTEYYVDKALGFIRMNVPLMDGEVLAVAYRDSSGLVRGDIHFDPETSNVIQLRLLKTQNPRPSDKTWNLEWKHVYSLGSRSIPQQGFELRIFYKPPSGDPQETYKAEGADKARTWLDLYGLDRVNESGERIPDNLIDIQPNIISLAQGELYFPDLQPFDPISDEFKALLPASYRVPAIYDTTSQSVISAQSKFYLETTAKIQQSEYPLGMNVIENSEEVTLNGRKLQRGIDYTLDYFTGTLRILNEQALAANADLDISYESNQIFQIDKKTIMGVRGELGLWDDSFIGATFMYLNERTLEQKIRVGKGPMQNMIWDVNTSLEFKPFFLTRMANFLPFVDTRAPSSIKFEGEVAQILPNPNTRNNENTGDNSGVAYIDDFEAAKRLTPISIARRGWNFCSPPLGKLTNFDNITLEDRGRLIFYNPYRQVPVKEIWPNRDINANVAQTTNVLVMQFTPEIEPQNEAEIINDYSESWNGIQKALSAGYYNQSESKFLEVWVRGDTGKLHINLGRISEDIIPNNKLDTEDKMSNGIRNGLLDDGEDIGLDGMSNKDARAVAAGHDFWDLNNNRLRDWGEPWSNDDWSYKPDKNAVNIDYSKTNGTEGNENDYGGRQPDTEDMNGNGDVDLGNDYFEYTINLDKSDPDTMYITGKSISKETGDDYGWRQYRIPLNAPEPTLMTEGNPDLELIEYVRVWVDGMPHNQKYTIEIAELNLVGSEWKEMGVASPENPDQYEVKDDSTLAVTEVNTHDNPDYRPPPGVQGAVDRVTRVIAKEQSLVMKVTDLKPGYNAILQKTFYDAQDYINYKTMKMFVYGKDPYGAHMKDDGSKIEFFLRFGADMNNYYEICKPVYEGWNKNNVEVDLIALSQVKLKDSTDVTIKDIIWDTHNDKITKIFRNGDKWIIKGKPALRNIRTLVAGVKNLGYEDIGDSTSTTLTPFSGEIWLNELRLSNVKKDKGIAARTRLEFAWADLIRFNGEFDKEDADFHNVATRFGTGDNKTSYQLSGSVSVDKFLPAQLGLSIPVSLNYSKSEATPKYIPGTDVQVTKDLDPEEKEKVMTLNEKKGMSISLSVKSRSQNFFVKYLLSKLRTSYSRNESSGSNSRTKRQFNRTESGSVDWSLEFGRDNYVRPFKWMGDHWLVMKLSEMKLYYSPQSFSTRMSGNRSRNASLLRSGVDSDNFTFTVNRDYRGSMKIFESLSFDVNRGYAHDLREVNESSTVSDSTSTSTLKKTSLMEKFVDFIHTQRLGILTSVDQNWSAKYNPKLFQWFSPNVSYTVGFKYGFNRQQKTAARNATQNKTLNITGNLNLNSLAKQIYSPSRGGARPTARAGQPPARSTRPAPGAAATQPAQQQKDGDKEDEKEKKPGFLSAGKILKAPLWFTATVLNIFEPINVNYGQRTNMTKYGLSGMPSPKFQFGLSDSLGVPLEATSASGGTSLNRGSASQNVNIGASSGMNLGRNVKLTFKYDRTFSENASTSTTGQYSESWLKYDKFDMPFPNWTLRVSGAEKLPFVKNYMQRISVEHSFSGRFSQTFSEKRENITKEDKDADFRPLLGMTMTMKNGISMTLRYNMSEKVSQSMGLSNGGTRTTSNDLQFTANYQKRSDFRIPLPFLRNMRLKNNIDVAITFSMGSNVTEKNRGEQGWEPTSETSKWFFKPNITYSFSDKVRGGAHVEVGKTHNKMIGDTSYTEFMINVDIAIRGS
ncbi:cell surface protein SprA [candidate division KSB1 bacterium]|nr:cell surface protein SprA [candidate division KSB1 bacterium]